MCILRCASGGDGGSVDGAGYDQGVKNKGRWTQQQDSGKS